MPKNALVSWALAVVFLLATVATYVTRVEHRRVIAMILAGIASSLVVLGIWLQSREYTHSY